MGLGSVGGIGRQEADVTRGARDGRTETKQLWCPTETGARSEKWGNQGRSFKSGLRAVWLVARRASRSRDWGLNVCAKTTRVPLRARMGLGSS